MFSNIFSSITMAFESLGHNKVRAFLTMLGIIIGVAAVITMTAIGQGAKKAVNDQIASLGTNVLTVFPGASFGGGISFGAGTSNKLTQIDADAMRRSPLITAVAPIATASSQIIAKDANWSTRVNGTTPDYIEVRAWGLIDGSNFTTGDVKHETNVCILGKSVADQLFRNGDNAIGQTIRIRHLPFKVIAVLVPKGFNSFGLDQDDIILAPLTTVQKKLLGITWLNTIIASATSSDETPAAIQDVSQTIRAQHRLLPSEPDDFNVRSQLDLAAAADQNANTLTSLLRNAAIISLLVGGIGIMNIMLVTVTERTREIGIRKSLGAKNVNIMVQFLTEAMTLSLVGGVIGVFLGYAMSAFISASNGWTLAISPVATGLSFGAAALVGVFFGFYPAQKAARLNPVEALRYE
ncbi:MAG TPA: ABC transporter permease [Candidatus Kapabacteria bacterium]|nr:ABC transporter permease [Candidatus Kapabacteria bacterium]